MRPIRLALPLIALAAFGCSKEIPRLAATDTEGRTFELKCTAAEMCEVSSSAQPKPSVPATEGAKAAFVVHKASRMYGICDVWMQGTSAAINPADCRALTCVTDDNCPPARGMTHGTCANKFCIEPDGAMGSEDAVLLCLAGTGVPAGTTRQIERFALGSNCGTPCRVPAVCRQP